MFRSFGRLVVAFGASGAVHSNLTMHLDLQKNSEFELARSDLKLMLL